MVSFHTIDYCYIVAFPEFDFSAFSQKYYLIWQNLLPINKCSIHFEKYLHVTLLKFRFLLECKSCNEALPPEATCINACFRLTIICSITIDAVSFNLPIIYSLFHSKLFLELKWYTYFFLDSIALICYSRS